MVCVLKVTVEPPYRQKWLFLATKLVVQKGSSGRFERVALDVSPLHNQDLPGTRRLA